MQQLEHRKSGISKGLLCGMYLLSFSLMMFLLLSPFVRSGRSLVIDDDGIKQHIKALDFYGRYLRMLLSRIAEGHLHLPAYSLALGYGADVITTLHYYVIGDSLNVSAVFFDTAHIVYLYNALIVVRMGLSGLSFLAFAHYTLCRVDRERADGRGSVISAGGMTAGAMLYVFSAFSLYTAARHPFFINPMIWFPLILLGVEKIFREKKHLILTLSVMFGALSNFYFFYMMVLLTVLYVLWRILSEFGFSRLRNAFGGLFMIIWASVLGVMLSSILFWPVVRAFLSNPRLDSGYEFSLRYPGIYYRKMAAASISGYSAGNWTFLGYTGIGAMILVLLFLKFRRYTRYKVLFVLLTLMLCIPAVSFAISGFSYVSNRWTWAVSLFMAWITAMLWNQLADLKLTEGIVLALLLAAYRILVTMAEGGCWLNMRMEILLAAGALLIMAFCSFACRYRPALKNAVLLRKTSLALVFCLLAASLAVNAYYMYSKKGQNFLKHYLTMSVMTDELSEEEILSLSESEDAHAAADGTQTDSYTELLKERAKNRIWNTEGKAVRAVSRTQKEDLASSTGTVESEVPFARYTGDELTKNGPVIDGMPSIQFYWSLSNGYIASYLDELANNTYRNYDFRGLDDRAMTSALAGIQYYTSSDERRVPYGYERVPAEESPLDAVYPVYRNKLSLPFGYTFDRYIREKDYLEMDAFTRQEAMLQGIVLKEEDEALLSDALSLEGEQAQKAAPEICNDPVSDAVFVPYRAEALDSGVEIGDNCFIVSEKGAKIRLTFEGTAGSETCLYVRGLTMECSSNTVNIRICAEEEDGREMVKSLIYLDPKHSWYAGRHDFIINMGYRKDALHEMTVMFPKAGTYRFENLGIVCQGMKHLNDYISHLTEDVLENVAYDSDPDTFSLSRISGDLSLNRPKILSLALPYSDGWTARIDGNETPVLCGNEMYLTLPVPEGSHRVELIYRTPGAAAGLLISLSGLLLLIGSIVLQRKKTRR